MERQTVFPAEQGAEIWPRLSCGARKSVIRASVHAWLEKKLYACTELQGFFHVNGVRSLAH